MTKLGETGTLLSNIDALSTTFDAKESPLSDAKETKLLSVLQTDSSKVGDESGEPLVVYHGTNAEFDSFAPDIRYQKGDNLMDNADNLSNAVEDYNGFLVKVLSGSKDSKAILQYVAGLKIGSEDYTAKVEVVVGVKEGKKHYDHELITISKERLIDTLNLIAKKVGD